jgi:hypothetical protein
LLSRDESYFSIDYAQITGIDCETSCHHNDQSTMKSIYYLGLVFYVLFSGRELPPADNYPFFSGRGFCLSINSEFGETE